MSSANDKTTEPSAAALLSIRKALRFLLENCVTLQQFGNLTITSAIRASQATDPRAVALLNELQALEHTEEGLLPAPAGESIEAMKLRVADLAVAYIQQGFYFLPNRSGEALHQAVTTLLHWSRPYGGRCEDCGYELPIEDVDFLTDPYARNVNRDYQPLWICRPCVGKRLTGS